MHYGTTRCTGVWGDPPVSTLSHTPRLDGLPTSSEVLVSVHGQGQDKTSTLVPQHIPQPSPQLIKEERVACAGNKDRNSVSLEDVSQPANTGWIETDGKL